MHLDGRLVNAWRVRPPAIGDMHWTQRADCVASAISCESATAIGMGTAFETLVVIELPDNWTCERGTKSKDSGAIQKVYLQVGMIISLFAGNRNIDNVYVVEPNGWKGQTPKHIMRGRCAEYCQQQGFPMPDDDDAMEAIMLGRKFILKATTPQAVDEPTMIDQPFVPVLTHIGAAKVTTYRRTL